MNDNFSRRNGFYQCCQTEISVRNDAPYDLRGVIVQIAYDCGFTPSSLRDLVCKTLKKRKDNNNWSPYPNIDNEVRSLIDDCEWYRVYDVIESIANKMLENEYSYNSDYQPDKFEAEVNEYFIENGIGWKLDNRLIEMRGDDFFEKTVSNALNELETKELPTAKNELTEAIHDLSRRPSPDLTGAIQHSMAALECVTSFVCSDEKSTLGELIKRYPNTIPKPLDQAIAKIWGFASENARHINEGCEPSFEEAELIVTIAAGVSHYLAKKHVE